VPSFKFFQKLKLSKEKYNLSQPEKEFRKKSSLSGL
jgi:hypothetical protein